jgi:beta-lactamase class A
VDLAAIFEAAGCEGFVHACEVDGDGEIGLSPDAVVASASVYKVSVALEFFRQAAVGELDPAERVRVDPADSVGAPAGLSLFSDEVEVSLRDLAVSMVTISDALASDVLLERVGVASVNALTESLGLPETHVVGGVRWMFDSQARDVGFASAREFLSYDWPDPGEEAQVLRELPQTQTWDPARTNRTTPREMTRLVRMVWRDEAGPPEACSAVRRLMGLQLQHERIARGFPQDGVRFAGKTGSFGPFRNEAGVVHFPGGERYAVSVFTRSAVAFSGRRAVDDAIGEAAAAAVGALRS